MAKMSFDLFGALSPSDGESKVESHEDCAVWKQNTVLYFRQWKTNQRRLMSTTKSSAAFQNRCGIEQLLTMWLSLARGFKKTFEIQRVPSLIPFHWSREAQNSFCFCSSSSGRPPSTIGRTWPNNHLAILAIYGHLAIIHGATNSSK